MSTRGPVTTLYVVGFLDLFAVSLVVPLLSKHARDIGASPSTAGIIGSVYGALQLVSSPLIGRWSDVSGRRLVLACSIALSAIGYFLLGFSGSIWLLALARVPPGCFKHTQDLVRTTLADMTPDADHSRVFGQLNAVSSVGFIIGPVVGGYIVSQPSGFSLAAMVTTALFLTNEVIVWLFLPPDQVKTPLPTSSSETQSSAPSRTPHPTSPSQTQPPTSPSQTQSSSSPSSLLSFTATLRRVDWRDLWDLFLVRFLLGFAVLVYRSNFVLMLDYKYGASSITTGYISSYTAILGTASGFSVGRIATYYRNDAKLLLHCGIIQLASLLLITFSPSLWMLIVAVTPLSLANQVARVCSTNLTIRRGQGEDKGTMLGLGGSILSLARMLSPALGGFAQELHLSGPGMLGSLFAGLGVIVMATAPGFLKPSSSHEKAE